MLRLTFALAVLLAPVVLRAQPAPEKLLREVRHDEANVLPKYITLTAEQVKTATNAAVLEIDNGEIIVQAVEIELPKGDNSLYASVEFESPVVRDARGATVSIVRQPGFRNESRNSVEHRLFAPGGVAPARFARVTGRVTVRVPMTVETRTIRRGEPDALATYGAVIDGPFVRYRRNLVVEPPWDVELRPVRAYDAGGRRLEREGTYPDRVTEEGFEAIAFYGSPATVEIDVPGAAAILTLDYDLTVGNRGASKITKRFGASELRATSAAGALTANTAPVELERLGYPTINADHLLAAAANGDARAVSLFLAAGVPVNAKGESGMTAMHVAARTGKNDVVDVLLNAGADVNAQDANDLTALFALGARCDQTALVAKLIAKGADVNAKGKSPVSPLGLAKSMNCSATVEALTKAGAK